MRRMPYLSQNTMHITFCANKVCLNFVSQGDLLWCQCIDCCLDFGVMCNPLFITCDDVFQKLIAIIMESLQEMCQCWLHFLCFVFWYQLLLNPPGTQFSEQQMLYKNFVQQKWKMTAEFRNCKAMILHNAFQHKLHKVVHNDGWPPTTLLTMHMLSTCCELSASAMHYLLVHDVRPIDLAQLTINFDRCYALCIQDFYHRLHFTVGWNWNKSLRLQVLQRCYCENLGSPANACIINWWNKEE